MLVVHGPKTVGAWSKVPACQVSTMFEPERVRTKLTGGLDVTVMEALVPVTPLSVALTVALPVLTEVIKPLPFTMKTFGLLLVQLVTKPVTGTADAPGKVPVTEAC